MRLPFRFPFFTSGAMNRWVALCIFGPEGKEPLLKMIERSMKAEMFLDRGHNILVLIFIREQNNDFNAFAVMELVLLTLIRGHDCSTPVISSAVNDKLSRHLMYSLPQRAVSNSTHLYLP